MSYILATYTSDAASKFDLMVFISYRLTTYLSLSLLSCVLLLVIIIHIMQLY